MKLERTILHEFAKFKSHVMRTELKKEALIIGL